MTEPTASPWFDHLSAADKASYLAGYTELLNDMHAAMAFLHLTAHMRNFPVRSYSPDIAVQYFVRGPEAASTFDAIARSVTDAGGTSETRETLGGSVHHVAELPFGSGRAVYRATWIQRMPVDTDE